jgi:hypothetical protein
VSDHPATFTVYTPSGPTNACVKHARAIENLFVRVLGFRVQATKAPEGAQCDNCINESRKAGASDKGETTNDE